MTCVLSYSFRNGNPDDANVLYNLVVDRMAWMDRKGIRQWNVTEYLERFPIGYYVEMQHKGQLYVLTDDASGKVICAAVLKESDDRWPDDGVRALYLHNFTSIVGWHEPVGDMFLDSCLTLARRMHKDYLRLDCAIDNAFLNRYYSQRGYADVGFCTHGLYRGVLRQKIIRQ